MRWLIALVVGMFIGPAQAALSGPLKDIDFLVGQWKSEDGRVADTDQRSRGSSIISVEADGNALLRRDQTQILDRRGRPTTTFRQLMVIYPEGATLRADYQDGEGHVIHYTSAVVKPGKSVSFAGVSVTGPTFVLTYELQTPNTVSVVFGIGTPGQVHPIATGTLVRRP